MKKLEIPYRLNSMVLDINKDKEITVVSRSEGLELIKAKAIILAMGCRERPRGALNIPGYRPAGISAGVPRYEDSDDFIIGITVVTARDWSSYGFFDAASPESISGYGWLHRGHMVGRFD